MKFLFAAAFFTCLCGVAFGVGPSPDDPRVETGSHIMPWLSRVPYDMNTDALTCDFQDIPCAPLSDVTGFKDASTGRFFAAIGVSNGVDIIDVTNPRLPLNRGAVGWIPGCITEWRDMKAHEDVLYVVTDRTQMCECEVQPCAPYIEVTTAHDMETMRASIGSMTAPLSETGPVTGNLALTEPLEACDPVTNVAEIAGKVAVIDRGTCALASKVKNAQAAGAIAVVIVNNRDDIIYPSMNGNSTGVTIPGAFVGQSDGVHLKNLLASGNTVSITLDENNKEDSDLFGPPEGLTLVDISDPLHPELIDRTREFFDFSHNIYLDPFGRKYLYACGMDTYNGGLLVLDITDTRNPVVAGAWNLTYFHDIDIRRRGDQMILFGSAIYDGEVIVVDVTDPTALSTSNPESNVVARWKTVSWPHNSATTTDGNTLYLTHEDTALPVTIWDVSDLQNPVFKGNLSVNAWNKTIPHNAFVRQNKLWLSYYTEGVAVYDVTDPFHPKLMARNDTSPKYYNGFHGVWGIYPYRRDDDNPDIVYASDIEEGFYILQLKDRPVPVVTSPPTLVPLVSDTASISASAVIWTSIFLMGLVVAAGACVLVCIKRRYPREGRYMPQMDMGRRGDAAFLDYSNESPEGSDSDAGEVRVI